MQDDVKKRIENAVGNYIKKHCADTSKLKRTHGRPEKEVEKSVMQWLSSQNIFAQVIESKAVFSQAAGRYLSGQASAGFPDLVGINCHGAFLAIELKAQGRRSTVKQHQLDFLLKIISMNGFACVTDSVLHLSSLYFSWVNAPLENRQTILLNDLPRKKVSDVGAETVLFKD